MEMTVIIVPLQGQYPSDLKPLFSVLQFYIDRQPIKRGNNFSSSVYFHQQTSQYYLFPT